MIGLDGATFDVMDPLIARGELPNLEKMIRQGCRSRLRPPIQPYSAQAWSSFMTGMNPGKHGIIDFTEHSMDDYSVKFLNASYRKAKTLWRILSDSGKKVGVVNVPFTYPLEKLNGFAICGMDAPGLKKEYFFPTTLFDDINREVGKYVIEVSVRDFIRAGKALLFLEKIQDAVSVQFRAVKYLMKNKAWDFLMYVCRATDQVQHFFWKYSDQKQPLYVDGAKQPLRDAISSVYRQIDNYIGEVLAELGEDDTLIIMSDHGHGGNHEKAIYLNRWLNKLGLLEFKHQDKNGKRRLHGFAERFVSSDMVDLVKRITPRGLKSLLLDKLPFVRDKIESHLSFVSIDWSKTKAYSEENRGNIWINLKGRQRYGIVEPGSEYEELRDRIARELVDMADPITGEKIVKQVFEREEIYSGPYLEKAPDILFVQRADPYAYLLRKSKPEKHGTQWLRKLSEHEKAQLQSGSHRLDGILILTGGDVKWGIASDKDASIMDIAPTVLYLMGLPVPSEMDGQILKDFLTDDFLAKHEIMYSSGDESGTEDEIAAYSPDEQDIIAERLKGLGYLD